MEKISITVECPKCGQKVEATYVGTDRELLTQILQRAGIQPGDLLYSELMKKMIFAGE